MNKKILIGSILSVVILILVSFPIVICENENPEIESLDNGEDEIFSSISGTFEYMYRKEKKFIIYRDVEFFGCVTATIKALTRNISRPVYYAYPTDYIKAPLVIGWGILLAPDRVTFGGITFGNIKWS